MYRCGQPHSPLSTSSLYLQFTVNRLSFVNSNTAIRRDHRFPQPSYNLISRMQKTKKKVHFFLHVLQVRQESSKYIYSIFVAILPTGVPGVACVSMKLDFIAAEALRINLLNFRSHTASRSALYINEVRFYLQQKHSKYIYSIFVAILPAGVAYASMKFRFYLRHID